MENYREGVLKTESVDFEKIKERLNDEKTIRILHAAMGICTEAGELMDAVKKYLFYGKEMDQVNMVEELGDLGWYEEILMDTLSVVRGAVERINIKKLKKRYEGKFVETKAIGRDLDAERKILEGEDEQ